MKVYEFTFDEVARFVAVAAKNVQDAIAFLCRYDYFDGWPDDDGGVLSWRVVPDEERHAVRIDEDPSDDLRAMPGATFDTVKNTITATTKEWASTCKEAACLWDSEG